MRFPLSKVYRAFPELDRFSDADCRYFCRDIYRREKLTYLAPTVFGVSLVVLMLCMLYLQRTRNAWWLPDQLELLGSALFAVPSSILAAIYVRDRFFHRAVRERILGARCSGCRFSLIGLPVRDGTTRCPECGATIVLSDHGLVEADISIERSPSREAAAPPASEGPA